MLGSSPLGGITLGGNPGAVATVAPATPRTAAFVTTGHTSASFEKPAPSASFEQAEALVVH